MRSEATFLNERYLENTRGGLRHIRMCEDILKSRIYLNVIAVVVENRDGSSSSIIRRYRRNTWTITRRRWPRKISTRRRRELSSKRRHPARRRRARRPPQVPSRTPTAGYSESRRCSRSSVRTSRRCLSVRLLLAVTIKSPVPGDPLSRPPPRRSTPTRRIHIIILSRRSRRRPADRR